MGKHSNKKKKVVLNEDFNFSTCDIGSVRRVVARHALKDRVRFLEQILKIHAPLIQAMKVTTKAYQDGVMEGIRQVAATERERETNSATPVQATEATAEAPSPPTSDVAAYAELPDASASLKAVLNP